MDAKTLKEFDEASDHPYECYCKLCQQWWEMVPSEDEDEDEEWDCGEDTCVEPEPESTRQLRQILSDALKKDDVR